MQNWLLIPSNAIHQHNTRIADNIHMVRSDVNIHLHKKHLASTVCGICRSRETTAWPLLGLVLATLHHHFGHVPYSHPSKIGTSCHQWWLRPDLAHIQGSAHWSLAIETASIGVLPCIGPCQHCMTMLFCIAESGIKVIHTYTYITQDKTRQEQEEQEQEVYC